MGCDTARYVVVGVVLGDVISGRTDAECGGVRCVVEYVKNGSGMWNWVGSRSDVVE